MMDDLSARENEASLSKVRQKAKVGGEPCLPTYKVYSI